jgi:UrcA family protein
MNTQSKMNWLGKASTVALCAAVAVSFGGSVLAQSNGGGDPAAIRLPYSDRDIHTVAGAKRLAQRIKGAVDDACWSNDPLVMVDQLARCRQATIARTVAGLDAPLVRHELGLDATVTNLAQH